MGKKLRVVKDEGSDPLTPDTPLKIEILGAYEVNKRLSVRCIIDEKDNFNINLPSGFGMSKEMLLKEIKNHYIKQKNNMKIGEIKHKKGLIGVDTV